MAEEKKYEITISDLSAYIGAAAFEILPEDAKEEDVDKYAMVAAGITRWDNLLMNLEWFAKRLFKL